MMTLTMSAPQATGTEPKRWRVLVGDDQADVLEALRLLLKGDGYQTAVVDSPQALLKAAYSEHFDLILMDLNYARDTTSGQEGLDLLASLQAQNNAAPVIVMTAWGSIDLAVEAMRRGARDFVQKPWDNARLLATVRKQVVAATERLAQARRAQSELEIARNVQQKLFPHETKQLKTIEYSGDCLAAREVSGDYYDFLDLGLSRLGLVLADVSGKGVPAALLMANLQACFRSQTEAALSDPRSLLRGVNKLFYESTATENYATLFFGTYDDRTSEFRYVNCGHLAPILHRASGEVERLEPTATVIGAFRAWDCIEAMVVLRPGDRMLVFSDGVTEAGIESGEEFGEERLIALSRANRDQPAANLVRIVMEAASQFGGGSRSDDLTVVGVSRIESRD
jgi:sigma-B regulation protein RsbU (phosphoserine phosphatase)